MLMQANLFWDNSIANMLNLLCGKSHASSSFQSKDTVEADLSPPFPKTRFKKPTWNRPNLSIPVYSYMTTLKLLFLHLIYYVFSQKQVKYSDCNWTRSHNHLVLKWTLNHLTKRVRGMTRTHSQVEYRLPFMTPLTPSGWWTKCAYKGSPMKKEIVFIIKFLN